MLAAASKQQYMRHQRKRERRPICGTTVMSLLLILLIVTTCAKASDSAANWNICTLNHLGFSETQITAKVFDFVDTRLVVIGREIVRPHVVSTTSINSQQDYAESLPAVPAAILMVLIGFLCVSLVRDRKGWLAVLGGLLWWGCAGVQTVPQLTQHLCPQTHISRYPSAGPVGHSNTFASLQTKDNFRASQFAITKLLSCLITAANHLVSIAEQPVCFSPAFIFDNLSRAPPRIT
jgi:hypothetical protein